ncbi:MAG TPA: hypothetical protein VFG54_00165 [Prolixibacteraceae bacterium]|nr:hypothetical protein [Prolixibacteraceae bacterium]
MKTYKPYLSLGKNSTKYELGVIVAALKNQTITSIHQEEIKKGDHSYWGVIITLSDATQLVNGPENPVFSTTIEIALERSASYQKILCCTQISTSAGKFGPSEGDDTEIGFGDGKP